MEKQIVLFEKPTEETKYSTSIKAPVYTPRGIKPHILELRDKTKTNRLIREIEQSGLDEDEKNFLIDAAQRHIVFNYENIAEYYAHSSKEMQELMEKSALVIIDFDSAIEYGFVRLCSDIEKQYLEEYNGNEK